MNISTVLMYTATGGWCIAADSHQQVTSLQSPSLVGNCCYLENSLVNHVTSYY